MPSLRLESTTDSLDLDYALKTGMGVQVLSGVTGLGLPPVAGQWLEGAGDGAVYRGGRVLARDIDLPLLLQGLDRPSLKDLTTRLSRVLSGPMTLRFVEDDGTDWSVQVQRVGGGTYTYGQDTTGHDDLLLVITVRAGDPFWTSSTLQRKVIAPSSGKGLISGGSLATLQVSSSQALGSISMVNSGDAAAYPTWIVHGPGKNFKATSPSGDVFLWTGTLVAGQTLTIDTKAGTVVDNTGANRYGELAAAPRFWTVPPGTTTAKAEMDGVDSTNSYIECTWRPRKWMVV